MVTYTPNYGFALPGVNDPTDQDLWGGYLNDNFEELDTLLEGISIVPVPASITGDYTLTTDDNEKFFLIDTTGGNITFTVPNATSFPNGFVFGVKKISASNSLNFSGTIDGNSNPSVDEENKAFVIIGNGTSWYGKGDFSPSTVLPVAETIVQKKIIQSTTTATLSSTSYSSTGISFSLDNNLSDIANKVRITVYGYAGVGSSLGNALYFTIKTGATDLAPLGTTGLAGVLSDTPNGPTETKGLSSYVMFAERTPGSLTPETYTINARAAYTATSFYVGRSGDGTETLPTTIIIEEVQIN